MDIVKFTAAIRGFHVYQKYWTPQENQVLSCEHELDNPYDLFAIKTCLSEPGSDPQTVGHFPLELSRITKFLLDRGAVVTAVVSGRHYRRSVLVQGGLEVPCVVTAKMIGTKKNKELLSRYFELAKEMYEEVPEAQQIIVGTFSRVEEELPEAAAQVKKAKNPVEKCGASAKKASKSRPDCRTSYDIRDMFKRTKKDLSREEEKEDDDIINID